MGQRSKTASDLAGRCVRCWMLSAHCICSRIPLLESGAGFLVLRHAKERWRSTNTARIAALALPSTRIVDYGRREQGPLDLAIIPPGALILFPSQAPVPRLDVEALAGRRPEIVVPDGNWHQAGRLARRLLQLPQVRAFALAGAKRAAHTLRRAGAPGRLSTIEAMASALEWLGEVDNAEALRTLYRVMVEASIAGRGGRNRELLGEGPER